MFPGHALDGKYPWCREFHSLMEGFFAAVTEIIEQNFKPIIQGKREGASINKFLEGLMFLNKQFYFNSAAMMVYDNYSVRKTYNQNFKLTSLYNCNVSDFLLKFFDLI